MTKDAEHKRLVNKEHKRAQRLRDDKPGARRERHFRLTDKEHKVLKHTLKELRK